MDGPRIPWVIYIPPMLWQYWYWQARCWYWVCNDAIKTGAILLLLARMCVSPPPVFRRQIWFGSNAERSGENPLVIKEFILSHQCWVLVHVLMLFIRRENNTFFCGHFPYLHKRVHDGLCSLQITKYNAIIHLATNHWAESYALLNCTQVENQIYNEGEMLVLSIIEVICKIWDMKRSPEWKKNANQSNNIGLCTGYIPWK